VNVSHTVTQQHSLYSLQRTALLSLTSGILLILIQPPLSLFFLAYIALVPLLSALKGKNLCNAFLAGMITGIISYTGLLYWVVIAMNRYGGIDIGLSVVILILLVLYLSLYTACFTLSITYLHQRLSIPFFLSAPCVWVLLEYVRGIALTGFPWSLLAYSQHTALPFIQVVSLTGPYFISYMVVAFNTIFFFLIDVYVYKTYSLRRFPAYLYTIVIFMVLTASLLFGLYRLHQKDDTPFMSTIIQGNIAQDMKWDEASKIKTIQTYYTKTRDAGQNVDLIVWPETAMPFVFDHEPYVKQHITALPALLNTRLLFGTLSRSSKKGFYNATYVYEKDGSLAGIYRKVHLVPFGEYTPLVDYFPFLEKLTAAGGDFIPGEEGHLPVRTGMGSLGILICYEGIFPSITNETVRNGAQVLVNITNDAWFGKTSAPFQHLAFYIFRAIETDRFVIRAANTGISAIIDTRGRILTHTDIFTDAVVKGRFAMKDTRTPYVHHGDYCIVLMVIMLLFVVLIRVWRASALRRGEKA